ncbi:hypothetical protein MNBD_BACTEROID03-2335 [hydrothermal vent metagenome]|uniref:Uncharacterized protein n=1 Tax=hydrothermal vent metagenome TaxID=652676 RepID=A0A3B0U4F1_9ZZZZ
MSTYKKILKLPIRISIAILLIGMLAKVLEKPYVSKIMLFGFFALGILYMFRFLKKKQKQFIDYTKLVLVVFWVANGIFRVMDFPYTLFFQIVTAIAFIIWFVMEGAAYFLDEDRRAKNSTTQILWNCTLVLGTLGVISGSLLRILHWDYAIHLLSLGITLIAAFILKDVFVPEASKEDKQNSEEYQL